ncbi:hypothetical protein V8E54_010280 [Elaphomyces granulatus]|jgi:hypothetical protein
MSLFNNSTSSTGSEVSPAAEEAAVPGPTSNALGIRDARGITPLSLPPEGEWESLEMLMSAAQAHARLAGYAVVQGPGGEKRAKKGGRWTKYLICKHTGNYDGRGLKEECRQRPNRKSKKTQCPMRMKIQERPGGSWSLRRMDGSAAKTPVDYCSHNHGINDIKAYHEHRGLSEEQVHVIRASKAAGVPVNQIKASLTAADPGLEVSSRDIYNWTARITRQGRAGPSAERSIN